MQPDIDHRLTKPRHPRTNGQVERMHLTPPGMNSLQQQARFDDFVQEFNAERPDEAIAMKCPAEVYMHVAAELDVVEHGHAAVSEMFWNVHARPRRARTEGWVAVISLPSSMMSPPTDDRTPKPS